MTPAGTVLVDALLVCLMLWVLALVRRGRLYIGYGVILLLIFAAWGVLLSVPGLGALLQRHLGPQALPSLGFVAVAIMVVYALGQLSILSNRVASIVHELALERGRMAPGRDEGPAR